MNKLFIMCGVPGSGKSYFAKKYLEDKNTIYVSRDEIRFSLLEEKDNYFDKEKQVFKTFVSEIAKGLDSSYNVIADATHLNPASRNKLLSNLRYDYNNTEINVVVMRTPLETCLERNETRRGSKTFVPPDQILSMHNNFKLPTFEECYGRINNIFIVENEKITKIERDD